MKAFALALTMMLAAVTADRALAEDAPNRPGEAIALVERLDLLFAQEARVNAVGERLSVAAAAAGWCDPVPSVGWTLGDLSLYSRAVRPAIRARFGLRDDVSLFVSSVAPDSTAVAAGLSPGVGITRIGDAVPVRSRDDDATRTALHSNERLVASALAGGVLRVEMVGRDAIAHQVELSGRPACRTRFELSVSGGSNAWAGGDFVRVTSGKVDETRDSDDELAAVLAHELAHNILRHVFNDAPADDDAQPGPRSARVAREEERDADRLGIWIAEAAGYDPEASIRLQRRTGSRNPLLLVFSRNHDRWHRRIVTIEAELALMRREKALNPQARPAVLDRARPSPVIPPAR